MKNWLYTRIHSVKGELSEQDQQAFYEEHLHTNLKRMLWFAIYIVVLQVVLNVLNLVFPQSAGVETVVEIPLDYYIVLSLLTLLVGVVYWILVGCALKGKINSTRTQKFLVNSLLYLYFLIQMAFCTFNILTHQGINGQMILVLLVGVIPIVAPTQSIVTIGASILYTMALMLATQWNVDAVGQTQWSKFFTSDMRAYFFVTNGLIMMVSVMIYRLYVSQFVLVHQLKQLSETDGLTGLYNRRKFDELLIHEWRRSIRGGVGLVLILFDIDFFKEYNDTYGHLKGDECLAQMGEMLHGKFQRANEYTARYRGEEFAIIMGNATEKDGMAAASRLIASVLALQIPHKESSVERVVTVSAGMVALVPHEGDHPEDLIRAADVALYEAKEDGRNRYVIARENESGQKEVPEVPEEG